MATDELVPRLVPNQKTIKAMKEARAGKLPSFRSMKSLMANLDSDD